MRLLATLFIAVFLSIRIEAESSEQQVSICMKHMAKALYGAGDFFAPSQCALDLEHKYFNFYKSELQNIRAKYTDGFSPDQIKACQQNWQDDWQHIYAKRHEPDFYFKRPKTNTQFWESLTDTDLELVNRAAFDMALTYFVVGKGRTFKAPTGVCYYKSVPWSFLRADNVSFVLKNNIIGKIQDHSLNKGVLWHVWYITQHADLMPQFQIDMLKLFEEHAAAFDMSETLLNSLRNRVQNNSKYYKDLK